MFLKNMEIIDQRSGFETGDDILVVFTQHLAQTLYNRHQLFRWRGPCFDAVLDWADDLEEVRKGARKVGIVSLEYSVESNGRSMVCRLSTAYSLISVLSASDFQPKREGHQPVGIWAMAFDISRAA